MASDFIARATSKHPGLFKKKAEDAGESTAEYASQESGAPGKLGKEARLAKTLIGLNSISPKPKK